MGISPLLGAGISGAASLFGASQQASASKKAAQLQAQTAMMALAQQKAMFDQTQANMKPYLDLGSGAAGTLGNRLAELTQDIPVPGAMTQAELEQTPGYQFTLAQGLKAAQGSAAARGLGLSGAALKGAAAYATGLSDQTYNTRFNQNQQLWQDQVTNQTNAYNKLAAVTGMGASTAAGQGQISAQVGNGIANNLMAAGNAQAAGINGAASSWTSGLNGLSNALTSGMNNYNANALLQAIGASKGINTAGAGLFSGAGGWLSGFGSSSPYIGSDGTAWS